MKMLKGFAVLIAASTSLVGDDCFIEPTIFPFILNKLSVDETIFEEQTEHHHIFIFQNKVFGRVLALDGMVQLVETDEAIYHEMLVHVPMLTHPNPKKVLIIGGGDGGSLREVLKHTTVEKVILVDISCQVIEYSKKYLPSVSNGAFEDPRVTIVIQDGMKFLTSNQTEFDVIICDTTDPSSPAKPLFTQTFYKLCEGALTEKGIMSNNSFSPGFTNNENPYFFRERFMNFSDTRQYVIPISVEKLSSMHASTSFGFASTCNEYKKISKRKLRKRLKRIRGELKYYNPEIHKAAFVLPEYMLDQLAKDTKGL